MKRIILCAILIMPFVFADTNLGIDVTAQNNMNADIDLEAGDDLNVWINGEMLANKQDIINRGSTGDSLNSFLNNLGLMAEGYRSGDLFRKTFSEMPQTMFFYLSNVFVDWRTYLNNFAITNQRLAALEYAVKEIDERAFINGCIEANKGLNQTYVKCGKELILLEDIMQ